MANCVEMKIFMFHKYFTQEVIAGKELREININFIDIDLSICIFYKTKRLAQEEKMLEQRFDDGKIESIEEFQPPEVLYEGLIARVKKYHPSDDITLIEKAYNIAREAHKDQVRKSGEPYIIHPLVCVHYPCRSGNG